MGISSGYGSAGMTGTEAHVMSLWDSGSSMQRIERETGLTYNRVKNIVTMYNTGSPDDHWQKPAIAASSRLLAALQQRGFAG